MYKLAILNAHPIQYSAAIYRRLAEEPDLDFTVYFCSHQGAEEYFDADFGERIRWDVPLLDGYKHRFLKNLRKQDVVGGFWTLINPGIISELRSGNYDALWVNGHNYPTYLLAICAARMLRIPVLMRCETHLLLHRSRFKRLVRSPLMSFLYNRLCAACLAIGERNKEFYRFHGVSEDRLFQVPYVVDNHYFIKASEKLFDRAQLRRELGIREDTPVILFASKLRPGKRPMDLLLAFHGLKQRGIKSSLVYVGAGPEERQLRDYVRENGLSDVYFFGFRNQSELPKFFFIADVFVFPSENEAWGLILNEAMCAGLPVIVSTEVGAAADLVRHGENGYLFDPGNADQLESFLRRLLEDLDTAAQMGETSRAIIQNWNCEACVRGIRAALRLGHRRLTDVTIAPNLASGNFPALNLNLSE